ncbi:MAG: ABC transporter ATP-binding protein [Candidatus Parcubacteria bacterium]|nr:ABC transporter ATP-binding protein [Candidatus Paceibacterota bacterium]
MSNIAKSDDKLAPKLKADNNMSNWGLIQTVWKFLGKERWWFLGCVILMGFGVASNYAEMYLLGKIADTILTGNLNQVYYLIGGFLGIGISTGLLYFLSNNRAANIELDTIFDVRDKTLKALAEFDINWHQSSNSGNKIQKIETGIGNLKSLIKISRRQLLNNITGIISIGGIFLVTDFRFLLIVFVFNLITYFVQRYYGKKEQIINKELNKQKEVSTGKFFEIYNNITTLKVTGSEQNLQNKLREDNLAVYHLDQKIRDNFRQKNIVQNIIDYAFKAIVILFLSYAVLNKSLSVGTFVIYYGFFDRLSNQINNLIDLQETIRTLKLGIERMLPILDEQPERYFGTGEFPIDWSNIEIDDLQFTYNQGVTTNLEIKNLAIKKGQKIGLVGRSGSGKSTLVKILMGLYKTTTGKIYYNSPNSKTNFYDMNFDQIVNHQAVVLQETELFNMTLEENITLLKTVDKDTLEKSLRVSQLEEVIKKLPKGLETKVGEKGYKLSGGQKQRVGIARAICSGAEILIFDEATSALDSQTELDIQNAIQQELADKTMIIVAHRLSTLRQVDKIIVFEDGQIVETGKFTELIANPKSHFAKLWQLQKSGVEL